MQVIFRMLSILVFIFLRLQYTTPLGQRHGNNCIFLSIFSSVFRKKVKKPPKVKQLSSKRRLSSFNGIPLPDINSAKLTEKDQDSAKLCAKNALPIIETRFCDDATQASSMPAYETWIEMGPDGEIVERRRRAPLPKSHSDSALHENDSDRERESRIDSILNRTRHIFNSEKLKKSVEFLSSRLTNEESKPSWTPDSDDASSRANKNNGSRLRSFASSGLKAPLRGLQEKIKVKMSERKMSQDSDVNANRRPNSSKMGFLSDIRSKFAISPILRTKAATTLSAEELERRKLCKTTIIDL